MVSERWTPGKPPPGVRAYLVHEQRAVTGARLLWLTFMAALKGLRDVPRVQPTGRSWWAHQTAVPGEDYAGRHFARAMPNVATFSVERVGDPEPVPGRRRR